MSTSEHLEPSSAIGIVSLNDAEPTVPKPHLLKDRETPLPVESTLLSRQPIVFDHYPQQKGDASFNSGIETENPYDKETFGRKKFPTSRSTSLWGGTAGSREGTVEVPRRDPAEDKRMLRPTNLDNLATINQHCFRGRRDFVEPLRILVIGGNGDPLVFLAVQCARLPNTSIVCIEPDHARTKVVQERLRNQSIRLGEPNVGKMVEFRADSISNAGKLAPGGFDYIHCGIEANLRNDSPDRLQMLGDLLTPDGCLGVTVHGAIGRTSVRQIEEIFRIVNAGVSDAEKKIRNANLVLRNLPSSNLHRNFGRWPILGRKSSDVYDPDGLRHDSSFTRKSLDAYVTAAGLSLCAFASSMKPFIVPEYLQCQLPQRIKARLRELEPDAAATFCEHLVGKLNRYEFYASKGRNTAIDLFDWDVVPFFSCYAKSNALEERLRNPAKAVVDPPAFRVNAYQQSIRIPVDVSPLLAASYPLIDDSATMREIVLDLAALFPFRTLETLRGNLLEGWRTLIDFDMIQFRHVAGRIDGLNRNDF